MKILFLVSILGLSTIVNFSAIAAATSFKIHINRNATVEIPVAIVALSKSPKENYFHGTKNCTSISFLGVKVSHTIQCLEFHTAFTKEKWVQVPVSIVDLTNEEDFTVDLAKLSLGIRVQKQNRQDFEWGFASYWMTQASDPAHYFYLIPKDRTYGLRIGPIADAIFANYDFQFQKAIWKFND